jgi:23S rRNA (uracil1939-C5)-methyltransferase
MDSHRLDITGLGAQGDGIATLDGRPVFVPLALPGETVEAEVTEGRARNVRILTPAPDRQPPQCQRYGVCGGCALQHLPPASYLDLKRAMVVDALAANGVRAEVDPVIPCPPHSRRRAVFAAARSADGGVIVGFNERKGARVIDLPDCAVLEPQLHAAIPALQEIARALVPAKGHLDIAVTLTAAGLDAAVTNAPRDLSADQKLSLASTGAAAGLARISVNGEVVVRHRTPLIRAGANWISPPPGGFLQAVESAETHMVDLVAEAIGPSRKVADLFSGAGTFTLPTATRASVHAVESWEPSLAALREAARAPGLKPVTAEKRDLFRRPLTTTELNAYDAAILDPPRAGAEAQTAQLAASKVRRVAMVSCSATTFARDIAKLVAGGYRLRRVTPVDQFLWSPHIEIVAALSR